MLDSCLMCAGEGGGVVLARCFLVGIRCYLQAAVQRQFFQNVICCDAELKGDFLIA